MGNHRIALCFEDETPADRARWVAWVAALPEPARSAAEVGERRPLVAVAAPFPARDALITRRSDEVVGLDIMRSVVESAAVLASATARTIKVTLSGRAVGVVSAEGLDAALVATLDEWQRLVDGREPDEVEWEREGWVSLWAGVLPRDDADRLFAERYGTDGPISPFARSLGILFYDHDFLERDHIAEPASLASVVARLSFAESFVGRIPEPDRAVTAVAVLFDADFSMRPRDAARGRLKFIGAFPYDRSA